MPMIMGLIVPSPEQLALDAALLNAVRGSRPEAVQSALGCGASITGSQGGLGPLGLALILSATNASGAQETLGLILSQEDKAGRRAQALDAALLNLCSGVWSDPQHGAPLDFAAGARVALGLGANPNARGSFECTPLMDVCRAREKPAERGNGPGWEARLGQATAIIGALRGAGADLDAQDALGSSALMISVAFHCKPLCLHLLAAGADPTLVDQHGRRAAARCLASAEGKACAGILRASEEAWEIKKTLPAKDAPASAVDLMSPRL